MAEDLMRYDHMAREALRGVVREAIRKAADEGLPGRHHFYISFRTRAPGVDLDPDLLEKHPHDMTIVLEHQFWDLAVDEDAFEVTLKFKGVPKYIRVPFDAVAQFHDPSVGFTLRFDAPILASGPAPAAPPAGVAAIGPRPAAPPETAKSKAGAPPPQNGGGQVVSIDAFRKKPD
jgi:hypothetical protein